MGWRAAIKSRVQRGRQSCQKMLSSHRKHYVIIALVVVDILGIFADIFISLITCDMGTKKEPWVEPTQKALGYLGLSIACIFLVELALCFWSFGLR